MFVNQSMKRIATEAGLKKLSMKVQVTVFVIKTENFVCNYWE